MISHLPHPRWLLALLVLLSSFFLLAYYSSSDSSNTEELASARSELLTTGQASDIGCEKELKRFEHEQTYRNNDGCAWNMFEALREELNVARSAFERRLDEAALTKAIYLVQHHQNTLANRSSIETLYATVRAIQALALLQEIAALSPSPDLRSQWLNHVQTLQQTQLPAEKFGRAIIEGEARNLPLFDDLPSSEHDRLMLAYAAMLRGLEDEGFYETCHKQLPDSPQCASMLESRRKQRVLSQELHLLAVMLQPRRAANLEQLE